MLGLLALAVALAVAWVVVESRSSQPLIDMRMMRMPVVWTTNLVALLFGVGMYATFAFLPEFLQTPVSAGYGFGVSITALLDDAKRQGRVRTDITSADLTMSLWSIRGVIETTRGAAPEAWRRHLDILIAGMRPAPEPLAHRPLTTTQLDEVIAKA